MIYIKPFRNILLVCSLLFLHVSGIYAQNLDFGMVPVNADWAAMAGTGVVNAGSDGIQWSRTAQLSIGKNIAGASVSFGCWQPELSDKHPISASAFYKLNQKLTLTLGTDIFNGNKVMFQDDQGNPLGAYSSKESVWGVGLGYRIRNGLAVGLSVDYTSFQLGPDIHKGAIGLDLSAMYNSGNIYVGALVLDLAGAELPGRGAVAVLYELMPSMNHEVVVQSETGFVFSTKSVSQGLGLRYTAYNLVSASVGYYLGKKDCYIPSHTCFGVGIHFMGVSVDCAYLLFDPNRGNSWIATLSYSM